MLARLIGSGGRSIRKVNRINCNKMKNLTLETDSTLCSFYDKGRCNLLYKCKSHLEYTWLAREVFSESQFLKNLLYDGTYKLSKKGTNFFLAYVESQKA
jgi:hypothetical protein